MRSPARTARSYLSNTLTNRSFDSQQRARSVVVTAATCSRYTQNAYPLLVRAAATTTMTSTKYIHRKYTVLYARNSIASIALRFIFFES